MKLFRTLNDASLRLAVQANVQEAELKESFATQGGQRSLGIFLLAIAALAITLMPEMALAQQPWETTAEKTYDLIMSIARWIAIIGVVACGLAAIFGKLSWEWAGKIIIGLVLIFGGSYLVDYFADSIN